MDFITYMTPSSSFDTIFHPQSDDQTTRVNQVFEQYLQFTIKYQEGDETSYFPFAKLFKIIQPRLRHNKCCSILIADIIESLINSMLPRTTLHPQMNW